MEKSGWSELPTRASGGFVRRREVASGQGPIRPHFLPAAEVGRVDRQVSHEGDVETLSSSHPAQSDFDDQSGRSFGQPGPSLTIRRLRSGCSGASGISSGTQTGRRIIPNKLRVYKYVGRVHLVSADMVSHPPIPRPIKQKRIHQNQIRRCRLLAGRILSLLACQSMTRPCRT